VLQAIVLDFDGVVVNSEPLHLRAFQEVLAAGGHTLSAQEYYSRYVGLDDAAMFAAFAREHGLVAPDGWVRQAIEGKTMRMQALLGHGSPLFPGASECIRELARAVPLAIASGALRHEILMVLEDARLTRCFGAIVAAGETPRGKPAPDPYLRAVELLGNSSGATLDPRRVVAVEDTTQGLAAARAALLRTVAVTTTYPADAVRDADAVVPTLREVTLPLLAAVVSGPGRGPASPEAAR
jgi:HAD superfamily hydrolase (TIGR01509 family)